MLLESAGDIGGVLKVATTAYVNAQNTSGTAAGLSATLAVASGGTLATAFDDKSVIITQDQQIH